MKTAVYNRYWTTGGGAERYAGALAEVLAADGPVELLSHEPFDREWLSERLRLDLRGCEQRVVEDSPGAILRAGAEADLFVNVSFMSRDAAPTRRSLYVVHFPTGPEQAIPAWKRSIAGAARHVPGGLPPVSLEWWRGFHTPEVGGRGVLWTDGDAVLRVTTPTDTTVPVRLALGFQRPAAAGSTTVEVDVDGERVAAADLGEPTGAMERFRGRALAFSVRSPAPAQPVEIRIRSGSFVPAEVGAGTDPRRLGVPVVGVQIGTGPAAVLARAVPMVLSQPLSHEWAATYGRVVSNSDFTMRWVERRWGVDSAVLHPPVSMHDAAAKEQVILSVGRFFGVGQGHSKRQLELVEAFRRLVDGGLSGWSLALAGGCTDDGRDYLDAVSAAAAGYPVSIHDNASGAELADLYGRAAVYWHAAGLGVDPERHPDVLEHFGISTVEAMSAGAVPVVLGVGGLAETVRHGNDGYHFRTLDGLVAITEQLLGDERTRERLAANAQRRAQEYSVDAFADRLRRIVAGLPEGSAAPGDP